MTATEVSNGCLYVVYIYFFLDSVILNTFIYFIHRKTNKQKIRTEI